MLVAGLSGYLLSAGCWRTVEAKFFVWLLMLMNMLYAAGYGMFSGIANVGDMAVVINGLEPFWLWRLAGNVVLAGCSYGSGVGRGIQSGRFAQPVD